MNYDLLKGKIILVVEDDPSMLDRLVLNLENVGCVVLRAEDVITAESVIEDSDKNIDFAIVDFYIPEKVSQKYDRIMRGEQLAYTIRKRSPTTKIIGISANLERRPFTPVSDLFSGFIYKGDLPYNESPTILFATMEGILMTPTTKQPKIFIIHGHDNEALLALKNYLQNTLKLGEPIILREKPSGGKTIIEKFEREAKDIDIVFVLLTPDDKAMSDANNELRRSRQNVIFEMGFFYAKLQRTSGRIIALRKGEVELPSDISGIVYIDISNGIASVGEDIRLELKELGVIS